MIIAVNIVPALSTSFEIKFIVTNLEIIVKQHADDNFVVITDEKADLHFLRDFKNVIIVPIQHRNNFFSKSILNIKIKQVVQKFKAAVVVTSEQLRIRNIVPQILVLNSTPTDKKSRIKFQKFLGSQRNLIITHSTFDKNKFIESIQIDPKKVDVIYKAVKPCAAELPEKEETLQHYTNSEEFFITAYSGKMMELLKAFSFFKKRSKSNMKLVVMVNDINSEKELHQIIRLYKHKEDVRILVTLEESTICQIIRSSYAFVNMRESVDEMQLVALKCLIPSIVPSTPVNHEVIGEAALFFQESIQGDLATQLMLMFKDENLRRRMIENAKCQSVRYNLETSASLLWHRIVEATE